MRKRDEVISHGSCWNNARSDELVFVLLARDGAAPQTLRSWASHRIALGKNSPEDPEIVDALGLADRMADEAARINYHTHGGGMGGHDEDEYLELYPGNFYRSRDGGLWCCYRVDTTAAIPAQASCIELSSGQQLSFYLDGRHDAAERTLVKELSVRQAMTCLAVEG